jgi:uncharacterized damage-inducible protein DinB
MKKMINLFAEYNAITNADMIKILDALPPEKISEDVGLYYNSILGVLNHLLVGDIIWMRFFADQFPEASSVKSSIPVIDLKDWKEIFWKNIDEYKAVRFPFDECIKKIFELIDENQYERELTRKNYKGQENRIIAWNGFLHVFNHHAHHRGQIATVLDQWEIENDFSNLIWKFQK